jgi:hypothetical protein
MSPTVSLSTRVSPEVRDRLSAAAAERGLALATYTKQLLTSAEVPAREDGDVVNEVECVFSQLSDEAGLERAVCLALARTAELGGTAGIAAGKELLIEVRHAQYRYQPEDEDEEEDGDYG